MFYGDVCLFKAPDSRSRPHLKLKPLARVTLIAAAPLWLANMLWLASRHWHALCCVLLAARPAGFSLTPSGGTITGPVGSRLVTVVLLWMHWCEKSFRLQRPPPPSSPRRPPVALPLCLLPESPCEASVDGPGTFARLLSRPISRLEVQRPPRSQCGQAWISVGVMEPARCYSGRTGFVSREAISPHEPRLY